MGIHCLVCLGKQTFVLMFVLSECVLFGFMPNNDTRLFAAFTYCMGLPCIQHAFCEFWLFSTIIPLFCSFNVFWEANF